jgi:hypothetical protein
MVEMDEPWGSAAYLRRPDYGWYPFTFVSDTATTTASITVTSGTTSTSDITISGIDSGTNMGTNVPYEPCEECEDWGEELSLKETIKEWHRALSRQAAWEAQLALRRATDDPHPRIPRHARKAPYVRPRAKKRVCAGSSRYRVLVN